MIGDNSAKFLEGYGRIPEDGKDSARDEDALTNGNSEQYLPINLKQVFQTTMKTLHTTNQFMIQRLQEATYYPFLSEKQRIIKTHTLDWKDR